MKRIIRAVSSLRARDIGSRISLVTIAVAFCSHVASAQSSSGSSKSVDVRAPHDALSLEHRHGSDDKSKELVPPQLSAGGVGSEQEVLENMRTIFAAIYLKPEEYMTPRSDLDSWFTPHLRDLDSPEATRSDEAAGRKGRALAGSTNTYSSWGCSGACPGCEWYDEHRTSACCGVSTAVYEGMIEDSNFKACCVRQDEEMASMEEIACKHPNGDGWAGLFEYYFPTNVIGVEPQNGATLLASREEVRSCMESSDAMMKHDTRAGDGLTMRINFAHMDPNERRALAMQFCMHPDQFMKLMDPQWDPKQKGGGPTLAALQALPIWSTYCPQGVRLMTDPRETFKVVNTDGTKTDLPQGMAVYQSDPQYCQKIAPTSDPSDEEPVLTGILSQRERGLYTQRSVGYTCQIRSSQGGEVANRMVPLASQRSTSNEPRTIDDAIPFLLAGGYYQGELAQGAKSVYKRFEPRPYSHEMGLFTGKKWKGGGMNELFMRCRSYQGESLEGMNRPDQLFVSEVRPKLSPSAEPSSRTQDRVHSRGVATYGAAFRIFATCPAGYVRWRGPHSERFAQACGEENFGGRAAGR